MADRQQDKISGARLAARVGTVLDELVATSLAPGVYLVATPIGNLSDITLRALAVLAGVDTIYCEDTRHSARLLQHYAIAAKTVPFHEHNEDRTIDRVLADAEDGKRVAIISDAGTPLLSDPGFRLVREAAARGVPVISIPGPSAVLTALTSSGLPTDSFFFAGFLPPKGAGRRTRLAEIAQIPGSLVIFEAPHRLKDALADMADVLGNRTAVVARELTKLHETVSRGTLGALAEQSSDATVKGEIVIVVGPPEPQAVSDDTISSRLLEMLGEMSVKDAAKRIAAELGVSRSRVYALGVKAKDGDR